MPKISNTHGFTLIELLVTVAIVGILASIAITNFSAYKTNSLNATAKSDLKVGIIAEEAYYAENQSYVSCASAAQCETSLEGFVASKDPSGSVVVNPFSLSDIGNSFTGLAQHQSGDITYSFDSNNGYMQEF